MASPLPSKSTNGPIKPRIIIHGGAGNLTRTSLSRDLYNAYLSSLNHILSASSDLLATPGITSLDVATYAVSLLENDALYNSGHGAVFTTAGHNELECSIMVSNGYIKRGVGCSMLKRVKNPIKLARELLVRGEEMGKGEAGAHCQYNGEYVEELAEKWGLEMVDERYYFTQRRWDEHVRGLKERDAQQARNGELSQWEKDTYLPQGTCGAVVMDSFGTICVATSTGGITNKVPGRIGDTPTLGAGFWAEEWFEDAQREMRYQPVASSPMDKLSRGDLGGLLGQCLPVNSSTDAERPTEMVEEKPRRLRHAVGISGTGNGDSFLKMCAARTAIARSRFSHKPLSSSTSWMIGRGGELQRSAGDRWGKTIEGTGGMIGIEVVGEKTNVVFDYNCGGLCRAWVDDEGSKKCLIFREDSYESGPKSWECIM
ncbi:nucleophile aminohydrolase [Phaeosphaeria sp. MPI-PUGE-AT-0046c]|nr:nucleophile aminohydrolase [Phaeosphaeria sp. MPI-PUGE-AT-0046c]